MAVRSLLLCVLWLNAVAFAVAQQSQTAKQRADAAAEALREAQAAVGAIKTDTAKTEAELRKLDEQSKTARTRLKQLRKALVDRQALAEKVRKAKAVADQNLAQQQARAKSMVDAQDVVKQRHSAQSKLLAALKSTAAELRRKIGENDQKAADAKTRVAAYDKDLASRTIALKKRSDGTVNAVKASLAAAKAETTQRKQLLAAVQSQKVAAAAAKRQGDTLAALETTLGSLRPKLVVAIKATTDAKGKPEEASLKSEVASLKLLVDQLEKLKSSADADSKRIAKQAAELLATVEVMKQAAAKAAVVAAKASKRSQEAEASLQSAKSAIAKAREERAAANRTASRAFAEKEMYADQLIAIAPTIEKASAELERIEMELRSATRKAQSALKEVGQFTSFANDIAPLFAKRCMVCHTGRNPGGDYNMQSYAAILKGGESGPAFDGSVSESSLMSMISDGSMPKDDTALSATEVATVRRWLQSGAPLDAGKSPHATLAEVMPAPIHPLPPAAYSPVAVTAVAFSPDGKTLVTSGYREVLLWNEADGKLKRRITNIAERVYGLQFGSDGKQLVVAAGSPGRSGEVKLVDLAQPGRVTNLLQAEDVALAAQFSPDCKRIATASADGTVRVFQVRSTEQLWINRDHAGWVNGVAWSRDGQQLATAGADKSVRILDATTGEAVRSYNKHTRPVRGVTFSTDGKYVVSASADREMHVVDVVTGKQVRRIRRFAGELFDLRVADDGHVFAVSADRTARRCSIANGSQKTRYSGHRDAVYSIALNADASQLATGGHDGEVRIWNVATGKLARSFVASPRVPPATASR